MAFQTRRALLTLPNLAPDLRTRLDLCGSPASWGWQFCRTASCDRCRRHRVRAWTDDAVAAFGDCAHGELYRMSITLDPAPDVDHLRRELSRTRKAVRNLMVRVRSKDARADDLRLIGAFQFEWLDDAQVWQPRLDLLVDLARLPDWKLRDRLDRQWPGRVIMTAMPVDAGEAIQGEAARWLDFSHQACWPSRRLLDLHHAMHDARGFSMSRLHLRPAREWIEDDGVEVEDDDAMPTLVGWSDLNPFRR